MTSTSQQEEIVPLIAKNIGDLFNFLNQSEGEVVLDLSLERENESPFLRVFNETPQLVIAHPLDETRDDEYELESHEISREKFESIITSSEMILIKPRADTPFSREVQQQLWNKEQPE